jgi:predicted dinucleotide-binding enzyme
VRRDVAQKRTGVPLDGTTAGQGGHVKIGIIGAGNVGSALARAAKKAGHDVSLSASDAEKARSAAEAAGASAASSNSEAASGADILIMAVPFGALEAVASEIGNTATGIVIDATNPLKDDFSGLAVTDKAGAQLLQEKLPRAKVVKAFNTVFASKQADPVADGVPLDGFYAGDDPDAKAQVAELLSAIGYRPVDAGGLGAALALEHMAFLNIGLNASNGWSWQSGWKLVGPLG